jgi:hypothetical protein
MQVTLAVNTYIFKAWNLNHFPPAFMHPQVNKRFYLKAITVDFKVIQAILPEGVVTVA